MEKRIVVMGGSFNPPTIAHHRLMAAVMETLGAEKGIFVPVGKAYLKRKMRKASFPLCLSEALRLEMLRAMCRDTPAMEVSDIEMRSPELYTEQTMRALQESYPDRKLYFLAGADKLPLLRNWAKKTAFLEQFGVAIVSREGVDSTEMILQDELLAPHQASLIPVRQPEGMETVSSTAIREAFLTGKPERAQPMLHQEVWTLFRQQKPEDYPPEIEKFQGDQEFLSNGFLAAVTYEGLTYRCAEAAFQAARSKDPSDRKRFLQCDGGKAKSIAAKVTPREDWEDRKLAVMEDILQAKFCQNPELARKLAETGNAVLIFGNNGKDLFWGMDLYTCQGENQMGKLLMNVRRIYRQKVSREQNVD